jgi:hypothetical protein
LTDISKTLPLALGLCAAMLASSAAHAQALVPPAQDLTGVWWAKSVPAQIKPMDGSALPYTAEGRKLAAEMQANLKSGELVDRATQMCLPKGLPRAFATAWPIQVLSTPGQTTFFFEENRQVHQARYIPQHHKDDFWDPSYMGDSIAKWQGDTLVVDSRNFNDEILLDASGIPHSEKLKVTQKVRKIDGGKALEVVATVEDPDVFSKPWSARFVYDRRDDIEVDTSWICGEPHRDVSKVQVTQ